MFNYFAYPYSFPCHIQLTVAEKKSIQMECVCLLKRLHQLGLAHLDFTPENVLYDRKGLRLCDFAKATPITSNNLRHVKVTSEITELYQY